MKRFAVLLLALLTLGASTPRDIADNPWNMFHKERFLFAPHYLLVTNSDGTLCAVWDMYGGYGLQLCTDSLHRTIKMPYRDAYVTRIEIMLPVQATVEGTCKLDLLDGNGTVLDTSQSFSNRTPYSTYTWTMTERHLITAPTIDEAPAATDGLKIAVKDGDTGLCQSTGQVPWIKLKVYGYYVESPYNYVR